MRDALHWIAYLMLTIAVIVVVLFTAYRLRGPSETQREALAVIEAEQQQPTHGINAFPLLWFMQYDVPDDQLDARMAEEIAGLNKRLAADAQIVKYEPLANKLPEAANDARSLCGMHDGGCLAKVRADPRAARNAVASFPRMFARREAFARTDFYWDEFPANFRASTLPHFGVGPNVWLTAYALEYVDGHRADALADVCMNIGTWRRLRRGTNSLTGSALAMGYVNGGLRLFAEMLADLPQDAELPRACTDALAPVAGADVDRCAEFAHEFRVERSAMDFAMTGPQDLSKQIELWLVYDRRQSEAWRAEQDAAACGDSAIRRMLGDVSLGIDSESPVTQRLECISSVTGCIFADTSRLLYADFDRRALDYAAHLRLAATLLWLRAQGDADVAAAFDRRPDTLRSGHRKSGFEAKNASMFVENMDSQRDAVFELPVRASGRRVSAASSPANGTTRP